MANSHGNFYIKILKIFGNKINIDGNPTPPDTPYNSGSGH